MRGHRAGSRSRDRGLALVLVMMVVLALSIIATPFVLSMILQERTGTVSRYASQADYGTEGVRNYAIWRLMYGVEHVERRGGGGGGVGPSWHYDIEQEFEVRIDDNTLSQNGDILDPKGSIWGLDVQDEQGKIDVRTAPRDLILAVRQMVEDKIVDRKDYLTMYAGRDATWLYPQRIRAINGQGNALLGSVGQTGAGVDNPYLFGPGARVRASKPGAPPFYAEVTGNGLVSSFGNAFTTDPSIPGTYLDGVVEVEQRHPVNINTAKPETLTALFAGVRLLNEPDSIVDGSAAAGIARLFAGKRTETMEDFIVKLQSASLSPLQRRAVILNAIAPTYYRLAGSGTMPLCFATYDTYTIEAFASQNNPAGATMASRGFREVVSVSPPSILSRFCESQYDFDRMLFARATLNNSSRDAFYLAHYPYGYKIVSFPNLIPVPPPIDGQYEQPPLFSDLKLKPQPPDREALVQSSTAMDVRGLGTLDANLQGWPRNWPREHFGDTQEGRKLNGAARTYEWNKVFANDQPSSAQQQNLPPTRPSVAGGGMEMWVRFDSVSNPEQLFDIREEEYVNRLGLRIDNGELILQASDGTIPCKDAMVKLEHGAAIVRNPSFTPENKTWYHFGAYWMGTELGGLALLVDGFGHPQQTFEYTDENGDRLDSELTGALAPGATSIAIKDPSWIPDNQWTALQIGSEVVLYDKAAGQLYRGARRTQEANHPSGARVRPWGYSSRVMAGQITWRGGNNNNSWSVVCQYPQLTQGGGKLLYNFGGIQGAGPLQLPLAGTQQDPMNPNLWFTDVTETEIQINDMTSPYSIMDFPDQGYIHINGEIIHYTGRVAGGINARGTGKFTGCTRAEYGASTIHPEGSQVRLWSVAADVNANYLDPTILLIGDEFFGPLQKCKKRPGFWIPPIDYVQPQGVMFNGLPRSRLQSLMIPHNAAEFVSPTFLAADSYGSGRYNMGKDDWVTLTEASNLKESAQVRRSGPNLDLNPLANPPRHYIWGSLSAQATGGRGGAGALQLVGLYEPTARAYSPHPEGLVRALKFPSGELLGRQFVQTVSPQFSIGPMNTTVDEIKFFATLYENSISATPLGTNDDQMMVAQNRTNKFRQYGGLIRMGSEYMGFLSYQNLTLSGLKRGYLHSTPQVHDAGDPIFNLYMVPVTSLAADVSQTDTMIQLNEPLRGHPRLYRQGYVLIDDEILGFEHNGVGGASQLQGAANTTGGTELRMPARWDGRTGLYRGMFGTQPSSHSATDALVYGIPWRYWDTYKAREFDNTMSYLQWSTRLPDAQWHDIRIETDVNNDDPNIVIHAVVRVDGKGDFWDVPGFNDKSLIVEFANGKGGKIDRVGYMNDAGQLDVRFYFEYKPGAFNAQQPWAAHSWKRTARVKEIQVDYDRPTRTLYHEDK